MNFGTGTGHVQFGDGLPTDESQEVFAHFGLAIHTSNVLEFAVLNSSFVAEIVPRYREFSDAGRWEAKFDAYFEHGFAQTFGNLIKLGERAGALEGELLESVRACKQVRDNLTHHFMRESAGLMFSEQGRRSMIEMCMTAMHLFEQVEKDLQTAADERLRSMGVDLDKWNSKLSEGMHDVVKADNHLD